MTKAELIREIKRIQKEEQDYQTLFKLMLKRSGKDIRSMSDEDKKKFFSAVDKAYKAKTEGKLIINENIINSLLGTIALFSFFSVFMKIAFAKGMKFVLRKGYAEICEKIWKKLIDNQTFINNSVEILKKNPNVTITTADEIFNQPIVIDLAKKELNNRRKEFKSKDDFTLLIWEHIVETLADTFYKTWKDNSVQNAVVNKLKSMLKVK